MLRRLHAVRRTAIGVGFALATLLQGAGGQSLALAQGAPSGAAGNCAGLLSLDLQALGEAPTRITSAATVSATDDLPGFCRVQGYVAPQVRFEVRLPSPETWNGRFDMAGCGGMCGDLEVWANWPGFPYCNYVLRRNYAVATTDTGHTGKDFADGLWAYNNQSAQIDFAYRGVHVTAVAAKAITTAYYSKPIAHSYFGGCSTGGRQAVVEAARFPGDFEGILSGDPALEFLRAGSIDGSWTTQANRDASGRKILDDTKLPLLGKAVHAACDGPTLLVDGVIDDPRACKFDPAALQCSGDNQTDCLTAPQVDTLRKFYGGAKNSVGEQLTPGLPFGSELNWDVWVVGQGAAPSSREVVTDQRLKYLVFPDPPGPRYNPLSFNFDVDVPRIVDHEALDNATNPDLTAFNARGGKLLMYQGWADPAVTPLTTINYYENVVRTMGGREQTQQFFRLFMIPGMYHCSGGPGADPRDNMFAAIENWVENGVAPDQLIATHATNGTVDRTRPIYPYPKFARYSGSGSQDDAANFIPVDPSR